MPPGWEHILREWGYPTLILVVVALVIKWALWPYLKRMLDRAEKQTDIAQEILTQQLQKAEQARVEADASRDWLARDFARAIEENNRVSRRIAESLDELLKRTKAQ